jgi:dihydrodipicolinate synthase/N-acetylneuraminate lyase
MRAGARLRFRSRVHRGDGGGRDPDEAGDLKASASIHVPIPALCPGRRIEGVSAVLLPFTLEDTPDWEGFHRLLESTWSAGLTPAVNMDTGYVHLLTIDERERVLATTGDAAAGRRFIAGAFIDGLDGDPSRLYARDVDRIRRRGGEPIIFQSTALARGSEAGALEVYRAVAAAGPPLLAFELGQMFAPFGRIYSLDFFARLMDLDAFVGLKHSSLDRACEWTRLALRDQQRPGFRIYSGNDLAIDMAFYGSDYLLGLSAFSVEGFATRDRLWCESDARAIAVNDVLQYLGQVAFRPPVPAYKHSAAQFLKLRGAIATDRPHPRSPRRPAADESLLQDIADRLAAVIADVS